MVFKKSHILSTELCTFYQKSRFKYNIFDIFIYLWQPYIYVVYLIVGWPACVWCLATSPSPALVCSVVNRQFVCDILIISYFGFDFLFAKSSCEVVYEVRYRGEAYTHSLLVMSETLLRSYTKGFIIQLIDRSIACSTFFMLGNIPPAIRWMWPRLTI